MTEAEQQAKKRGKYHHPLAQIAHAVCITPVEMVAELKSEHGLDGGFTGSLDDVPDEVTLRLLQQPRIWNCSPVWTAMLRAALEKKMQICY